MTKVNMKVNELRVGNSVTLYGKETQIGVSDFFRWYKDGEFLEFEPIAITEKELEKYGFYTYDTRKDVFFKNGDLFDIEIQILRDDEYATRLMEDEWGIWVNNKLFRFRYIHQLQNFFFGITQTEMKRVK